MRKIAFVIWLILFCGLSFFAQSEITSEITQEEYEFYGSFLDRKYVINRYTQKFDPAIIKGARKKMRKAPRELFEDFELKNRASYRIGEQLVGFRFTDQPQPNYNTANEIVFVFEEIAHVSRVSFTKDKKQALIFCSYDAEATFGASSHIYWVVKEKDVWEIKDYYAPWIH